MSTLLTKEQIKVVKDLNSKEVFVKEWGGTVRIRTLSSAERDAFEKDVFARGDREKVNLDNFRARFVALTLVDEKGERLFVDEKDVIELGKKSASALDFVFQ